ncbi:hypothetical protein FRB98_006800 [Tulasnella sp. 332]|nr:hypothetical protein FRB98_006800 [Tulasnella sp. 332]
MVAIDERNEKMQSTRVDLLQFHWNDYRDRQYMDALLYLQDIRNAGVIGEVGLVNFDAIRTDEICTQFPGLVVSNQVQVSGLLRDQESRPAGALRLWCFDDPCTSSLPSLSHPVGGGAPILARDRIVRCFMILYPGLRDEWERQEARRDLWPTSPSYPPINA